MLYCNAANAATVGQRLPCSQFLMASTETSIFPANTKCKLCCSTLGYAPTRRVDLTGTTTGTLKPIPPPPRKQGIAAELAALNKKFTSFRVNVMKTVVIRG